MSPLLRFLPFLFFLFLFVSSAALASDAPIANNNNKAKLLQLIKGNSNKIKTNANEDPATESTTTTTIAPTNPSTTAATTTTTAASTTMEQTTIPPSTTAPVIAYIRLVLTLKQKVAERLITPNAQGNTRKKLRTIIADAIGRPAEGLNITMTIDDVEGKNPNKKNPKVLLILVIALSSTDSAVKSIVDGANNSSSALSTQLMEETGADSISVQTTYGFPPSSNSDGLPFTSSDGSLFEAYKTLILAVSISVIGVVFLGAVILFLTKTKERRERLLELFRFGGRLRREQNHSSSTFDDKRNSGSKRVTKKSSTRHSGRTNSGRTTTSGRNSTINSTINSSVASVVKNQV